MSKTKRRDPITSAILGSAPEVLGTIGELLGAGADRDEIVKLVVSLVDGLIDWRAEIPKHVAGPFGSVLGSVLEAADGALLTLAIRCLVNEVARKASEG
jgi:hypothetical protein